MKINFNLDDESSVAKAIEILSIKFLDLLFMKTQILSVIFFR